MIGGGRKLLLGLATLMWCGVLLGAAADLASASNPQSPSTETLCVVNGSFVVCPTGTTPVPPSAAPSTATVRPHRSLSDTGPVTPQPTPIRPTPAPGNAPPAPAAGDQSGNRYLIGVDALLAIALAFMAYRYRRALAVVRRAGGASHPPTISKFLRNYRLGGPRRKLVRPLSLWLVAVVVAVLAYNGAIWYRVHTVPSDGYNQFLAWQSSHLPRGATVSVTEGSAQFLLSGEVVGDWDTLSELRSHRVDYVLVSVRLVDQGYTASPAFLDLLKDRGRLLYSSSTPTALQVYDVRALTVGR